MSRLPTDLLHTPLENLSPELRSLYGAFCPTPAVQGWVIAGGSIWRSYLQQPLVGPQDVDLFAARVGATSSQQVASHFDQHYNWVVTTQNAYTFKLPRDRSLQVIRHRFSSHEHLLRSFDYAHCSWLISNKGLVCTRAALEAATDRLLRPNPSFVVPPATRYSTLRRSAKYLQQGFRLDLHTTKWLISHAFQLCREQDLVPPNVLHELYSWTEHPRLERTCFLQEQELNHTWVQGWQAVLRQFERKLPSPTRYDHTAEESYGP